MSFRDPLVVLRPYPASTPETAIIQAARMAAAVAPRVSVIACGVAPKGPRSLFGNAIFNVAGLVGQEKQKSALDVQRLLSKFADEVAKQDGLTFGDCISEMRPSPEVPAVLAEHAQLYDLAIVPMPEGDYLSQLDAQWYAETILFGSGHPTIIVPNAGEEGGSLSLDRIIVAWDKSRSATRAIADALPVLRGAKQVRLLTVVGEKQIVSERSAAEFAKHLALQDVNVVIDEVDAGGRTIGEVLGEQVNTHRCNLIVMGAYGRSRIREFILGGATKAMLTRPPTALFMSH